MWVSNGTANGTHEVSLSGADSGGIFAYATTANASPDFTGVGNYVLFNGSYDNTAFPEQTESQGLWAFDETALTATQLVVPRTPQDPSPAFDPQNMFSYAGTVYFLGYGTHGATPAAFIPDLWVTDGTVAGTHDIGEGVAEATEGLFPQYFAAVGGRVAFSGYSGPNLIRNELWVTNGTTAGTIRLTSTTPAAEGVYGITPQFLTSFGDRIVFSGGGIDGSSIRGLWISDGTADGTHELTVAGASNSGLFAAGVSPNFTAYGDTALFAGRDVAGLIGLWRTDGTNTQEIWSGAISITSQHGLDPKNFSVVDGKVLFTGYDNDGNSALFEYNGTTVTELSVNGAQQYTFNPSAVTPMQDALPEEQAPCFCRGTRILTEAGVGYGLECP